MFLYWVHEKILALNLWMSCNDMKSKELRENPKQALPSAHGNS